MILTECTASRQGHWRALRDRGAIVTGIDKSAGMLELARRRLGDGADLQVVELGSPLPFLDDTFDDVTAPWYCTTWRTGGRHSPNCGASSSPADGSSSLLTTLLRTTWRTAGTA